MSFAAFASELQAANVIDRDWLFTTYARFTAGRTAFKPVSIGSASVRRPRSLLADLVAGAVATYEVRIVEGATIMHVMRQLAATPKLIDDLDPTFPRRR